MSARHRLTRHAVQRANQRGTTHYTIDLLTEWADHATPLRGGLTAWSVSDEAIEDAIAGGLQPSVAARLRRRFIVESDAGDVVTIIVGHGRRVRAYWKHTDARSRLGAARRSI